MLAGAAEHSPLLYLTGLAAAALSAAYAGKALFVLTRKVPKSVEIAWDEERRGTRRVPRRAVLSVFLLAFGAITLGALALPPFAAPFRNLIGSAAREPSLAELVVSALVASGVLVFTGIAIRRRPAVPVMAWPATMANWLHLESSTHRIIVRPTLHIAGLVARADDMVLDRTVTVLAQRSMTIARTTAHLDDAVIDGAVGQVTTAVRRAGAIARRPQTGQLHQYYLQALLVLGIAVVVLVAVR